ncbi:MAG: hypothetical protein ACTSVI_00465 [Promethearchaeota archaeon]
MGDEKERVLGFCENCKKYDYLDDSFGDVFCDTCGKLYKIVKKCPACSQLYLTPDDKDYKCQKCDILLKNPTVEQIKDLMESSKEEQSTSKEPINYLGARHPAIEKKRRVVKKDGKTLIFEVDDDGEKLVYDSDFWTDKYELKEDQSFDEYVEWIDREKPYGVDSYGLAFLVPHKKSSHSVACRFDMKYRADWGSFRRTGIGWRIVPTIYILLALFLPTLILTPLMCVFYGHPELYPIALMKAVIVVSGYFIIAIYFVKLIGYAEIQVDEIVKPYGIYHDSVKVLFRDPLEFIKWSKKLTDDTMDLKLLTPGLIAAIAYLIYHVIWIIQCLQDYSYWDLGNLIKNVIPRWGMIPLIFFNIGIALIVILVVGFFGALVYSLFRIGDLSSPYKMKKLKGAINHSNFLEKRKLDTRKRAILSIYSYMLMIHSVKDRLTIA